MKPAAAGATPANGPGRGGPGSPSGDGSCGGPPDPRGGPLGGAPDTAGDPGGGSPGGTADTVGGPGGGGGAGYGPDEEDRDPGLQPERTRLAWRRTTLSCAVTAVLAGRQALHSGGRAVSVLAVCLAALAFLAFLRLAHRRIVQLGRTPRPPLMSARAAAALAGCTVALALFGTALVW